MLALLLLQNLDNAAGVPVVVAATPIVIRTISIDGTQAETATFDSTQAATQTFDSTQAGSVTVDV